MARNFNGSSHSLEIAAAVSSYPVTMACWARPEVATTDFEAMYLGVKAASMRVQLTFSGSVSADPIRSTSVNSSNTAQFASTSSGFTAHQWCHAAAVIAGADSRTAYINGGSSGSDNVGSTSTSWDTLVISGRYSSNVIGRWFDGDIAEAAVWNVALTDAEIAQLAAGYSPLFVRPQSLVHYIPLFGRAGASGGELDWVGGGVLSVTGSPSLSDHPRIIYPSRGQRIWVPSAAAAAPTLSAAIAHNLGSTTVTPRVTFTR
jgi:hypothetical protein